MKEEKKYMLGIVIVNYNGEKFQNEAIASILNQTYQDFKIIIVDNNSTDNSMKMLDKFDSDKIIKIYNNENLGAAGGNNIGIKKSIELNCEYTLLINNDVILNEDAIAKLLACKKDIVCPKIYYFGTDKIWFYGGKFHNFRGTISHLYYQKEKYKDKQTTEYAPTCCMLIHNTVFKKTGLFDENYFLYYDDVDFCFQLRKNKIKIYLCSNAVIYHKVSLSSGGENSKTAIYYNNRNRFYYIKKAGGIYKPFALIFSWISMKFKTADKKIITEAIHDFKQGKMGRKEWNI